MSQSYSANNFFASEVEAEVLVQSSKCRYHIWITADDVTLVGPGVNETGDFPTMEGKLDNEDFAIFVVMLFENGLWPEE